MIVGSIKNSARLGLPTYLIVDKLKSRCSPFGAASEIPSFWRYRDTFNHHLLVRRWHSRESPRRALRLSRSIPGFLDNESEMVFKPKDGKFNEFENPNAYKHEDCLSCRVLGMHSSKRNTEFGCQIRAHRWQAQPLSWDLVAIHTSRACSNYGRRGRRSNSASRSINTRHDNWESHHSQQHW